jgi:hypothetical protein
MGTDRMPKRQFLILGLLLVTLAAVAAYTLGRDEPAAPASRASNRQRGSAANGTPALPPEEALDVRIETLSGTKPEPDAAERNPFRFRPKPPPPAPPQAAPDPRPPPPQPPPGPPPVVVPPIPLKFIGVIESSRAGKIAVLKDDRGVYHGREGETIEGRYRIVRIGQESIVMEYEDGRGRTTIRLTGQ